MAIRLEHLLGPQPGSACLVGGGPGARAISDKQVQHGRGAVADAFVARLFFTAQLEHVAQHRDLPPSGQFPEQIERGQHRLRAGVVAIVDDARAVDAVDHQQAQSRRQTL